MSEPDTRKPQSKPRTLLRRTRQWLAAIAAVLIIATAVVVGIGRLLIPYADELRPWLETRLSERLGQPVSIEQVEARWPRLTPQIILKGLRAGSGEEPLLEVARARLELHLPDLPRSDRNPFRLVLLGLDLVLAEDDTGRWGLRMEEGGRFAGEAGAGGQALAGDVLVRDVRVRVNPRRGPVVELIVEEGEIRRRGDRTGLLARAHLAGAPEAALSLTVVGERVAGQIAVVSGRASLRRLRLAAPGLDQLLPTFLRLPPDRLDADLAFGWDRQQGASADLDIELSGEDGFEAGARLRLERRQRRIDAELERLTHEGRTLATDVVLAQHGDRWAASVPDLQLADLHALLGRWLGEGRHWPTSLGGRVRDLELLYQHPGSLHRLDGRIENFAVDLPGDRVDVDGLSLALGVSGDRAALSLSGSPVVDWPARMRRSIPIDSISGRIIVSPRAVQLDGVVAERTEARARANGWIWLGDGKPFLDFRIEGEVFEPVDPRPWLPAKKIPPKALAWLDHALLRVGGASGGLNYHFRGGHKFRTWEPGNFQAWFDFRGAELDYWEDWPRARNLAGRADFVGRSLMARIDSGRLGAVPVTSERIAIDDLTNPEVDVALTGERVDAGALHDMVASFPIEGWSRFVDPLAASGALSVQLDLLLPVRRMAEWRMNGRVALEGTTLSMPRANLRCPQLRGEVTFDRESLDSARLEMAGPESAWLEVSAGFTESAWLGVRGDVPLSRMLSDRAPLPALAERLGGSSPWQVRLDAHPAGGWQLEASSDLRGVVLNLPQPLNKPARESIPLDLNLRGYEGGLTASARLGDLLALTAEQVGERWRLAAGLNQTAPALPANAGFEVAGSVDRLDLQAWSDWLSELAVSPDGGGAGRGRVRLTLGRLDYGDLGLEEIELEARRGTDHWQLALSGESAVGDITVPRPIDSGRVVAVDLQRLDLARSLADQSLDDLADAPVPAQTRTRVPTDFPPIHLLIEKLHYGDLPLGRVRIESHARRDGIEIERIEVAGPHLELSGYGRWILVEQDPLTEFEGRLISTDLSALLDAMGQSESRFEAARAQIDLEGRWTGSPFDFALARLSGTMRLVMNDGRIPEAQPGAGRVLGLISLSAMPRRLMLDFRDVFGEGLKFDRIEGEFELNSGVAHTDRLRLESPAADITVSGRTDLGGRTYDQTVVVEPGVSGTLPVLGGLAGGPAGAAAGLILRSLLERPLQGIAEARYRVTGSWENPEVELIDARAAEAPPPSEAGSTENDDSG